MWIWANRPLWLDFSIVIVFVRGLRQNPGAEEKVSRVKISVVIVNYNTKNLLLQCIRSVLRELESCDGEVFVVDNASSDSSVDAVELEFPQCRLLKNTGNLGFGKANNQAFALAKGEYILMLNPDAELRAGSLACLVNYLDEHPEVAVVGPRTLYPDGTFQASAFDFPSIRTEFLVATFLYLIPRGVPRLARKLGLAWPPESTREVGFMRGSCLLCRGEVLREAGGFDERYFLYTEEVDLQYRISRKGWKLVFNPGAEIIHHHGKSMEQDPESTYVELYRSKSQFLEAYHSKPYVYLTKALWILFHASRLAIFGAAGMVNRTEKQKVKMRKHRAALLFLLGARKQKEA